MLEDSYEPLSIEQKWQSEWELKNQFKPIIKLDFYKKNQNLNETIQSIEYLTSEKY